VPLLVASARGWLWGYLINGFGVIVGTIMMTYDSIASWQAVPDASQLILHSNLHLILLLLPKMIIGQRVLLHYRPNGAGRMFTSGWWVRHFIYLSAVFAAGELIGRI
jgi:protein-S-isoprenylcysteine O-methyltransferase Ste14